MPGSGLLSLDKGRGGVVLARYPDAMSHPLLNTTPTAEKPALSEEQRAERLRLLVKRLHSPDGLDRDALKRIEQLTGDEQ